jgi:hypothetical protein
MHAEDWLKARVAYLRGLKAPNDQQRLLLLLADKETRTPDDERKLAALVRAEKASERAQKARADAARIINADKAIERKARDHELYQAAGLLILAGLVDTKTGVPNLDRGALLGGLLTLSHVRPNSPSFAQWKKDGDALLAEKSKI